MSTVVLRKVGSSAGLILRKPDLVKLGAEIGDELEISHEDDGAITIRRIDSDQAEIRRAAREGMIKYRDTLRALADA